jgi:hypothetical protein
LLAQKRLTVVMMMYKEELADSNNTNLDDNDDMQMKTA